MKPKYVGAKDATVFDRLQTNLKRQNITSVTIILDIPLVFVDVEV